MTCREMESALPTQVATGRLMSLLSGTSAETPNLVYFVGDNDRIGSRTRSKSKSRRAAAFRGGSTARFHLRLRRKASEQRKRFPELGSSVRRRLFVSPLFTPASVPAKLEVYQSTSSGRSGRAVNETAALVVLITLTRGHPIMEMPPVCWGDAKHLTGGGGRRPRRCWRVGEATAVHRCSSTLSRCFTYPPSNWQMASDLR